MRCESNDAAIPAYRAIARRAIKSGLVGYGSVIAGLCRRLARSGNYVADREVRPTFVRFDNGRTVAIRNDGDGPYLEVGRS